VLRRLVNHGELATVPTVATAQAWRDGRRQAQLARALGDCRPEILSDELARKTGELSRRSQTAEIVDAVVIESAGRRFDDVYTSDTGDLGYLAEHIPNPVAIIPIGR
jgi:hypothetical protein